MPPLRRAVALAEMDAVAVGVEQHLHLDVARAVQRLLDQQIAAAERGFGFAASFGERRGEILGVDRLDACRGRHPPPPP